MSAAQNKAKKSWFSMRRGILLVIAAPLIFILSGLFLANTLVNPPESLAYRMGQVICFILAPATFALGMATCIKARGNRRKKIPPALVKTEEKRVKEPGTPMPPWIIWMRRALATGLIIWCASVILYYGPAVIFGLGPQLIIALVIAAYAFSKRRGAFGTIMVTLISAGIFASLIIPPLGLVFGHIPLGVPELIGDWIAGRNPGAIADIIPILKSGLVLSTGLAVFTSFLLGLKRLRKFEARRITKVLTVGIVLLPIAVACLVPTDEGAIDPSRQRPYGYGGSGPHFLWTDFNTTRVYENGLWVYTIYLYNRGSENTTITKIWVWHDLLEPLPARVTVNGTGISLSGQGVLFEPGASGTLTFTTAQGHNKITILYLDGESVTIISWRTLPPL